MTCREVTDILSEFVAGEMAPDAAARLETHFARCPNCKIFLVQFKQTVELARAAGVDVEPPADAPAELIDAVLAAIKGEDG